MHIESWDDPFAICLLQDERQVRLDMEGPYMPAASQVRGFSAKFLLIKSMRIFKLRIYSD